MKPVSCVPNSTQTKMLPLVCCYFWNWSRRERKWDAVVVVTFLYRLNQPPRWIVLRLLCWSHFRLNWIRKRQRQDWKDRSFYLSNLSSLSWNCSCMQTERLSSNKTLLLIACCPGGMRLGESQYLPQLTLYSFRVPYQVWAECRLLGRVLACQLSLLKPCQRFWLDIFCGGLLSSYPHIVACRAIFNL